MYKVDFNKKVTFTPIRSMMGVRMSFFEYTGGHLKMHLANEIADYTLGFLSFNGGLILVLSFSLCGYLGHHINSSIAVLVI